MIKANLQKRQKGQSAFMNPSSQWQITSQLFTTLQIKCTTKIVKDLKTVPDFIQVM